MLLKAGGKEKSFRQVFLQASDRSFVSRWYDKSLATVSEILTARRTASQEVVKRLASVYHFDHLNYGQGERKPLKSVSFGWN